jgi:hypothetical protein
MTSAKTLKVDKNQMPDKPKARYRIRNWARYNENLKERGIITLWIDEDVLQVWKSASETVQLQGQVESHWLLGVVSCHWPFELW